MYIVLVLFTAFLSPLLLHFFGAKKIAAWMVSCSVVPAFVLIAEFVVGTSGGGASMWPIALLAGTLVGAVAAALGIFFAATVLRGSNR